jgi:hypothetical protein
MQLFLLLAYMEWHNTMHVITSDSQDSIGQRIWVLHGHVLTIHMRCKVSNDRS